MVNNLTTTSDFLRSISNSQDAMTINYPVYMSAKIRRIYVTFGLTSVLTHEEYLARDVNLT